MTYEERMRMMSVVRPEKKDLLLAKILKGERVDITKNEDLFYQVNKDRVTLEEFTNRDKFKAAAQDMKRAKQNLHDPTHGRTKGKKLRWLGDIPAEIYFSRPEFGPTVDKDTRLKNIKKWLNEFSVFRAGDSRL